MGAVRLMNNATTNKEYKIARRQYLDDRLELNVEAIQKGYYKYVEDKKRGLKGNVSWKDRAKKRKSWMQ